VTVAKPGGFEFLDLVDLSTASVTRQGQDVLVSDVRIRDKASQQAVRIAARLHWFRNLQGLGLVEATTLGAASSAGASRVEMRAAQGSSTSSIRANVESPGNGQSVSGIAVIRGWTFAQAGRSIRRVQLFIDGAPFSTIPCCSVRGDIAAAFPGEPNARNSGFGITFNYGFLPAGVHTLAVQIEDSAGRSRTLTEGVLVKRPGAFEFLDLLDLSTATVRIAGGALVVEGAVARDSATPQTVTRILRYRFDVSAQAFTLVEESVEEVEITSLSCTIDGDTSDISALKRNPGADGISLPEVITAVNNTRNAGSAFAPWVIPGTVRCDTVLPAITRGNLTIDGDVDADGTRDVTLDGSGVTVTSSNTTVRSLAVNSSLGPAVNVVASPETSVSNVAVLGVEVESRSGGIGVFVSADAGSGKEAHLSDVLISGSRVNGSGGGVVIRPTGLASTSAGLTLRNVIVAGNELAGNQDGVSVAPLNSKEATLTHIVITNNTITNSALHGIFLLGGLSVSSCTIEAMVTNNNVQGSGFTGISLLGGMSSSNSTIDVMVANNIVSDSKVDGIRISGGQDRGSGNIVMGKILGNTVQSAGEASLAFFGGFLTSKNIVDAIAADNVLLDSKVDGVIMGGGVETSNNIVMGQIRGNQMKGNTESGVFLTGGWSASGSMIDTMVADNIITNSVGNGIKIYGGTTQPFMDSSGPARNNTSTGAILRNTIQGSSSDGVVVVGGFDNSRGEVIGNLARQKILNNTVNRTLCSDGIPGNRAECTFSGSASIFDWMTVQEGSQQEGQGSGTGETLATAVLPHLRRLTLRAEALRGRAQTEKDAHLRVELLKIAGRLNATKDKVARIGDQTR
jgi:hypothetical protein